MKVWWTLVRREFQVGSWLGFRRLEWFIAIVLAAGSGWIAYRNEVGFTSHFWLITMYLLFLYPTVSIVLSLAKERRRGALWLQLPQKAWKLLTAKYAAVIYRYVVYQGLAIGMFLLMYRIEDERTKWVVGEDGMEVPAQADFLLRLLQGKEMLTLISYPLAITAVLLLFVTLYMLAWSFSNRLGIWRWPASIAIVGFVITLTFLFEKTAMYSWLFQWGGTTEWFEEVTHTGEYLWELLNLALVAYVPIWLLDRKLEVS